jgi:hypothetical protein
VTAALIDKALRFGGETHTLDDVFSAIDHGTMQLWAGEKSVIVTEIQDYPQRRLLCLFLAAGNMKELQEMLPGVLEWAKASGCSGAFLNGRLGWMRSFLARENWKVQSVTMAKEFV